MKRTDLTGRRFVRWTVLRVGELVYMPSGGNALLWHCRCDCGTEKKVRSGHLLNGRSRSCGCLRAELVTKQKTTHGGRHTLLYDVWTQMHQRCSNPRNKAFKRYGGRGITVCARWSDFGAFIQDMGPTYAHGLTIDREKNDQDYNLANCRWVTNKVNCRNRDGTVIVEWEGIPVPLNELAERYGIKKHTLYSRVRLKGWPLAKALGVSA